MELKVGPTARTWGAATGAPEFGSLFLCLFLGFVFFQGVVEGRDSTDTFPRGLGNAEKSRGGQNEERGWGGQRGGLWCRSSERTI